MLGGASGNFIPKLIQNHIAINENLLSKNGVNFLDIKIQNIIEGIKGRPESFISQLEVKDIDDAQKFIERAFQIQLKSGSQSKQVPGKVFNDAIKSSEGVNQSKVNDFIAWCDSARQKIYEKKFKQFAETLPNIELHMVDSDVTQGALLTSAETVIKEVENQNYTDTLEEASESPYAESLEEIAGTDYTDSLEGASESPYAESLEEIAGTDYTDSLEGASELPYDDILEEISGTDYTDSLEGASESPYADILEEMSGTDYTDSLEELIDSEYRDAFEDELDLNISYSSELDNIIVEPRKSEEIIGASTLADAHLKIKGVDQQKKNLFDGLKIEIKRDSESSFQIVNKLTGKLFDKESLPVNTIRMKVTPKGYQIEGTHDYFTDIDKLMSSVKKGLLHSVEKKSDNQYLHTLGELKNKEGIFEDLNSSGEGAFCISGINAEKKSFDLSFQTKSYGESREGLLRKRREIKSIPGKINSNGKLSLKGLRGSYDSLEDLLLSFQQTLEEPLKTKFSFLHEDKETASKVHHFVKNYASHVLAENEIGTVIKLSKEQLGKSGLSSSHSYYAIKEDDENSIKVLQKIHGKSALLGAGGFKKVKRVIDIDTGEVKAFGKGKFDPKSSSIDQIYKSSLALNENEKFFYGLASKNKQLYQHWHIPSIIKPLLSNGEVSKDGIYYFSDIAAGDASNLPLEELDFEQFLDCLRQIGTGVVQLHEEGLVHRDIKPDNFLWFDETIEGDEQRSIKIKAADFDTVDSVDPDSWKYVRKGHKLYLPKGLHCGGNKPPQLNSSHAYKIDSFALAKSYISLCDDYLKSHISVSINGLKNRLEKMVDRVDQQSELLSVYEQDLAIGRIENIEKRTRDLLESLDSTHIAYIYQEVCKNSITEDNNPLGTLMETFKRGKKELAKRYKFTDLQAFKNSYSLLFKEHIGPYQVAQALHDFPSSHEILMEIS